MRDYYGVRQRPVLQALLVHVPASEGPELHFAVSRNKNLQSWSTIPNWFLIDLRAKPPSHPESPEYNEGRHRP